jgi:hypothetical protein
MLSAATLNAHAGHVGRAQLSGPIPDAGGSGGGRRGGRGKAVDQSDAATVQAAEMRAMGRNLTVPGDVATVVQAAANQNTRTMREEDKLKLWDVLSVRSLYETLRLIFMLKSSR